MGSPNDCDLEVPKDKQWPAHYWCANGLGMTLTSTESTLTAVRHPQINLAAPRRRNYINREDQTNLSFLHSRLAIL